MKETIKSAGCSRSQNVVTVRLECSSVTEAERLFGELHGAISRAGKVGGSVCFAMSDVRNAEAAQ